MGALNLNQFPVDEILSNNICPFCENIFKPCNTDVSLDGFEFICKVCNPTGIIGLSRRFLESSQYELIKANDVYKVLARKYVQGSQGDVTIFNDTFDF